MFHTGFKWSTEEKITYLPQYKLQFHKRRPIKKKALIEGVCSVT